jgi:hypothetical protein
MSLARAVGSPNRADLQTLGTRRFSRGATGPPYNLLLAQQAARAIDRRVRQRGELHLTGPLAKAASMGFSSPFDDMATEQVRALTLGMFDRPSQVALRAGGTRAKPTRFRAPSKKLTAALYVELPIEQ